MKYLVLHKFNRVEKDAVIDLDKNHFLTNYWLRRGFIKPYIIEEQLSKVVENVDKDLNSFFADEDKTEEKPKKKKRKIVKKKVENSVDQN